MHDMPDTDDQDADAEIFWPSGYKEIIRYRLGPEMVSRFIEAGAFHDIYEERFNDRFRDYEQFVERLAEIVVIGCENGAESAFDEIHLSFRNSLPLPEVWPYARYFFPGPFSRELKDEIYEKVFDEYSISHGYQHIYEDHYEGILDFDSFIKQVANFVSTGSENGADDALGTIYRSFLEALPLPLARRRPKRIR
ncbi:MAG: hypothetical protein JRF25_10715 [Deltaproteobacteria bacterium]|nr:hypothetical protein [Deltaproteobacteria bacterium]